MELHPANIVACGNKLQFVRKELILKQYRGYGPGWSRYETIEDLHASLMGLRCSAVGSWKRVTDPLVHNKASNGAASSVSRYGNSLHPICVHAPAVESGAFSNYALLVNYY